MPHIDVFCILKKHNLQKVKISYSLYKLCNWCANYLWCSWSKAFRNFVSSFHVLVYAWADPGKKKNTNRTKVGKLTGVKLDIENTKYEHVRFWLLYMESQTTSICRFGRANPSPPWNLHVWPGPKYLGVDFYSHGYFEASSTRQQKHLWKLWWATLRKEAIPSWSRMFETQISYIQEFDASNYYIWCKDCLGGGRGGNGGFLG